MSTWNRPLERRNVPLAHKNPRLGEFERLKGHLDKALASSDVTEPPEISARILGQFYKAVLPLATASLEEGFKDIPRAIIYISKRLGVRNAEFVVEALKKIDEDHHVKMYEQRVQEGVKAVLAAKTQESAAAPTISPAQPALPGDTHAALGESKPSGAELYPGEGEVGVPIDLGTKQAGMPGNDVSAQVAQKTDVSGEQPELEPHRPGL